jgi:hypothetical protein
MTTATSITPRFLPPPSPVPDPVPRIVLQDDVKTEGCYRKMAAGMQFRWIFHTQTLYCAVSELDQVLEVQITLTGHLKTV